MMPWLRTNLKHFVKVQCGYAFASSDFCDEGVRLLRISGISHGVLDLSECPHLSLSYSNHFIAFMANCGDIVIAMSGATTGKNAVVRKEDLPLLINQRVGRYCIKDQKLLDAGFLYLLINTSEYQKRIILDSIGGAQPNVSPSDLEDFPLDMPSIEEQKEIATVLCTWDRGVRQLTDLIVAKLRFKQGLMQQLLAGERRLKIFHHSGPSEPMIFDSEEDSLVSLEVEFGLTGKSFKEGIPSIGSCPSGWTHHSFRDLFEVVERPAKLLDDDVYQLVTAKRYRGGIVPREQLRGEEIKTKTQFFVGSNDFLISKRQIIHGACGIVPASLDRAVVSNEYACLRPSIHLDLGFLNYLTHTRYFQQTCFHASVGVTLEKMIFRLDQWLKHHVNLPPLDEQRSIANFLSTMDREILLLARQRRLLMKQKKGLMQKLLTGEVRVGGVL